MPIRPVRSSVRLLLAAVLAVAFFASTHAQIIPGISTRESGCTERSRQILILGSFHMDNPGQDAVNLRSPDPLTSERQRELASIIEKLARFKPTKIAIESAYRGTYWTSRYEQYLKGEYQLGRNEIEQIGFQLARRLNLPNVTPVDFPMWMNGLMPNEREDPKPPPVTAPAPTPTPAKPAPTLSPHLAKQEELLRTSTFLDVLRYLNSEDFISADHASYMDMLLPSSTIAMYSGADQLTNWYKRNLRIFANLNRVSERPDERVLLIIGAGHLKILRDFALDSSYVCLADTEFYLK